MHTQNTHAFSSLSSSSNLNRRGNILRFLALEANHHQVFSQFPMICFSHPLSSHLRIIIHIYKKSTIILAVALSV